MKKVKQRRNSILIICGIVLAVIAINFNIGLYRVEGESMEETLYDGDIVVTLKNKAIEDKDIVVCETRELYLKEEYIIKRYYEENSSVGMFLLGDNENNSLDSRDFGLVPKYACRGVAILRISLNDGIKICGL